MLRCPLGPCPLCVPSTLTAFVLQVRPSVAKGMMLLAKHCSDLHLAPYLTILPVIVQGLHKLRSTR